MNKRKDGTVAVMQLIEKNEFSIKFVTMCRSSIYKMIKFNALMFMVYYFIILP
jgi:hypothetical protein